MLFKRINRSSPEQIFVIVKNNDTLTMSTGHAAVYHYRTGATTGDGYSVHYPYSSTTAGHDNPALLAGVVAGKDIAVGEFGTVQCYGHSGYIAVTGFATAPFAAYSLTEASSLTNYVMRPVNLVSDNLIVTPSSALGYFAPIAFGWSLNVATTADAPRLHAIVPGGYVVPTDVWTIAGVTTTSPTAGSTGYTRGFIRCM